MNRREELAKLLARIDLPSANATVIANFLLPWLDQQIAEAVENAEQHFATQLDASHAVALFEAVKAERERCARVKCHHPPDRAIITRNRGKEPLGEQIRQELEALLDKYRIVSILLDTERCCVDVDYGPNLPPRIKEVLSCYGCIFVDDAAAIREGEKP